MDNTKMTDIEALKECRAMWNWLAANPTQDKYMYFVESGKPEIVSLCYMCAHVEQNKPREIISMYCSECLIREHVWPNGCTNGRSEYVNWMNAQRLKLTAEVVRSAKAIADACTTELEAREKCAS